MGGRTESAAPQCPVHPPQAQGAAGGSSGQPPQAHSGQPAGCPQAPPKSWLPPMPAAASVRARR
eukprot:6428284-Alexandrium_andersonii.AAC.1